MSDSAFGIAPGTASDIPETKAPTAATGTSPKTPDTATSEADPEASGATVTETTSETSGTAPVVSVIMPVYNAERYLDQALTSVQCQSLYDLEIIGINDGSTDGSLAIMQEHASHDRRIRVVDKPNEGYGATCNRGIDLARGTWIAILEPDDWVEIDTYRGMVAYAEKFDEPVDIVKSPYWRILDPGTPRERKVNCPYHGRVKPESQPFTIHDPGAVLLLRHHPSIWSALYRKSFLDEFGIRFPRIPGAGWADNPFMMETLIRARSIVFFDKPGYCYRESTQGENAAFANAHPLLPLERWNDMRDILDRVGDTDELVRSVHNELGFSYLSWLMERVDVRQPDIQRAVRATFDRMDDAQVFGNPHISTSLKRYYAEVKGVPMPAVDELAHLAVRLDSALYTLRNNGPKEALMVAGDVLAHGRARNGKEAVSPEDAASPTAATPDGSTPSVAHAPKPAIPAEASEHPMFSIVMPMYNSHDYIAGAIASIQAQTCPDWELIIVNDASTDDSRDIAARSSAGDPRIRIVDHATNQWLAAARNTGMDQARGRYLWIPDPDDTYEPTLLETCKAALDEHPSDVMVFGHEQRYFDADGKHLYDHEIKSRSGVYATKAQLRSVVLDLEVDTSYGYAWNKVYRLDHVRACGARFETVHFIEDILFNIAVFQDAGSLVVDDRVLYHYNKRVQGNLTNAFDPDYFPLHRRRIQSLRDQQASWGLLSLHTQSVLGCLFARYILSALERNHDPKAHMTQAQQEAWIQSVFEDPLFDELVMQAKPDNNPTLAACLVPLKNKDAKGSVLLGALIHGVRSRSTTVYTKLRSLR